MKERETDREIEDSDTDAGRNDGREQIIGRLLEKDENDKIIKCIKKRK